MRIAILEDEPDLADHVAAVLKAGGHDCQLFPLGKALIAALKRDTFDLLVLDWNLPDITGIEVLVWAKDNLDRTPPVLFVTSRSDEADIVQALDLGADDYVVKPIQPRELSARVGAVLRRSLPPQTAGVERFGRYAFDTRGATVAVDGTPVELTAKEFGLAHLLFRNLDRALSRAYLLERVWGHHPDLQTRTLDAHVSRIRTKLELRPEHGVRLTPVYSYGYRLERLEDGAA